MQDCILKMSAPPPGGKKSRDVGSGRIATQVTVCQGLFFLFFRFLNFEAWTNTRMSVTKSFLIDIRLHPVILRKNGLGCSNPTAVQIARVPFRGCICNSMWRWLLQPHFVSRIILQVLANLDSRLQRPAI